MPSIDVTGFSDEEKELIKKRAEEVDMTTPGFVRSRFRAGLRLWDAGGNFDVLEMQKRLGQIKDPSQTRNMPQKPASTAKKDRFEEKIKRNLPINEDDAVSKDDLTEIVTEKVIDDVLTDLRDQGEIEYIIGQEGFIRVK